MVPLDSASHDRAKQRKQNAPDVFDVREEDGPVRFRMDRELARAREEPVRSSVAVPRGTAPRLDAPSLAFSFGDGLPGIASVSATVLPGCSSPLIEGNNRFRSG